MFKIHTYSLGDLSQIVHHIPREDRIMQFDNVSQFGWLKDRAPDDVSLYFDDTEPRQYPWKERFTFWTKGGQESNKPLWPEHYMLAWQAKIIAAKLIAWQKENRDIHIACEYGKSRSVAVAQVAKEYYGYEYQNEKTGNLWMRQVLFQTLTADALRI